VMKNRRGALTPYFNDVQAHYDLSDNFFQLFLDRTQSYSCAYFEHDNMTLKEAQIAKIDLALGKLGLEPGMNVRLGRDHEAGGRDLRCQRRWPDAEPQSGRTRRAAARRPTRRAERARVELRGWEEFDEPVDRIVSIGAFEHFGHDRYDDFFAMAYRVLPDDGVMLLHTITRAGPEERQQLGCR
jgi:cyclopropane-fatty-acyl-phospholipid synthase